MGDGRLFPEREAQRVKDSYEQFPKGRESHKILFLLPLARTVQTSDHAATAPVFLSGGSSLSRPPARLVFFPFVLQRDPLLDGVKSSVAIPGNAVPQCGVLGLSPRSLPGWGAHQAHGCKHHPHRQSSVTLSHPQLRCDGSPRPIYPTLTSNRQTSPPPPPPPP